MRNFAYCALSKEGLKQKGWAQVPDAATLRRLLSDQDLTLIRHWPALPQWCLGRQVKDKDRHDLFSHIAALQEAGFPLEEAFEHYQGSSYLTWICRDIARALRQGKTLLEALTPFSDIFDRTCFCVLAAAQTPTHLTDAFSHLATHFEWRRLTKQEITKALIYPLCLLSVITFLVGFLMTQVVPQMEHFLTLTGSTPTFSARLLRDICTFIQEFGILFLGFLCLISLLIVLGIRYVPGARLGIETFTRRFPLLGPLWQENQVCIFLHSLCLMLRAGVPLLEALRETKISQNTTFQHDTEHLIQRVTQGASLSSVMASSGLFPKEVVRLCELGEKTGSLERYLSRASTLISSRLKHKTQKFLALLEPLSLIFVGGLLAWIVSSVFVPLYEHISLLERTS